ncbi:MAG: hypothetical protein HGB12_04865 [Bacteroidetes bacterium]|nr:hypothetical protein [Bacteroidota bacterium]
MNRTINIFLLITSFLLSLVAYSQNKPETQVKKGATETQSKKGGRPVPIANTGNKPIVEANKGTAKDNFEIGNYKDAITEYTLLLKKDSLNSLYNMNLGICYLSTNIDKSLSIKYLERAITDPKVDPKAWYELGHAYLINYRLDDAIKTFEAYKKLHDTPKDALKIPTERMIEMCEQAKKSIKTPLNVTFENLGPKINSPFPDYNPFVPADESFLVYTSRRAGTTGDFIDFDGYNTADVFVAFQKYEKWSKSKSIGIEINTELVEETVGLTPDGSSLFISVDNYMASNIVLVSKIKGKIFQKPELLMDNIISKDIEKSAIMSPNKKMIIISSDRNFDKEGMNLYISRILPTGEWGPTENIPELNTKYDECFPYFASDGKTLYFCSQGHNSIGGFDVFKSIWDEKTNTFSEPVNLGYPINTTDDDKTICFSKTGRYAYISALRKEGYGDLDIYRAVFKDINPTYSILSGTLINKDSINLFGINNIIEKDTTTNTTDITDYLEQASDSVNDEIIFIKNVDITVTDVATQKKFGKYFPNKYTGKFLIALPPGEYDLTVKADRYNKYTENIKVLEKSVNSEIFKNIILSNDTSETK